MSRPFCIGLTGGLAAGKSEVAARFAALGAEVVDTDRIARELTTPQGKALPAIVEAFGREVLAPDGGLDRQAMRRRVFADPPSRRRLEAILHPLILDRVRQRLEASNAAYVILVVPLLVEAGRDYRDIVDRVLVVDCAESVQLERAMARDAVDAAQARAIMAAQVDRSARLAVADDVLDNLGDLQGLDREVEKLHARYLKMAKNRADSLP